MFSRWITVLGVLRCTPGSVAKAKEWNRKLDGSEKYPTSDAIDGRKNIRSTSDKSPSKVGKKSVPGSEKSPTNQGTNNQGTNQVTSNQDLQDGSDKPPRSGGLVLVVDRTEAPRVEIATSDLRLSVLLDAADPAGGCSVPTGAAAGGVVHGGARARLDPAHAQRIVTITDDGDQGLIALAACQAYAREASR